MSKKNFLFILKDHLFIEKFYPRPPLRLPPPPLEPEDDLELPPLRKEPDDLELPELRKELLDLLLELLFTLGRVVRLCVFNCVLLDRRVFTLGRVSTPLLRRVAFTLFLR